MAHSLFTRHLASNQLFKSILDQLSLTATETLCQTLCIGLAQNLYNSRQGSGPRYTFRTVMHMIHSD